MEIQDLILQKIKENKQIKASEIVKATGFSRAYINRIMQSLRDAGKVILLGKNKGASYILANKDSLEKAKREITNFTEVFKNENLSEDLVLKRIHEQTGIFMGLSDNVDNIFTYAFLEMVNNAIEHSRSSIIAITMEKTDKDLIFTVTDEGVGIFNNIQNKLHLPSKLAAIQQLLKGKQTTDPKTHSGQGIFFTSKMADSFLVKSSGKSLRFLNVGGINDVFLEDNNEKSGTAVHFTISLYSKKKVQKIFAEYTDKDSFDFSKTKISVSLYQINRNLLSRSEARRIMFSLDNFQEIQLDFKGVKNVGQSFADEIFRVWQSMHPKIKISYKNADENAVFMIKRVYLY